jgi:O-methyltransferase
VLDRCTVVGGSFFEAVPSGGDLYILKAVLHDWDDEAARRVLARCREAISPAGTLLVVERVLAPPNEGLDDKVSDLNMLVNTGGLERTEDEFAALLASGGFELRRVISTAGPQKVLESVPA